MSQLTYSIGNITRKAINATFEESLLEFKRMSSFIRYAAIECCGEVIILRDLPRD